MFNIPTSTLSGFLRRHFPALLHSSNFQHYLFLHIVTADMPEEDECPKIYKRYVEASKFLENYQGQYGINDKMEAKHLPDAQKRPDSIEGVVFLAEYVTHNFSFKAQNTFSDELVLPFHFENPSSMGKLLISQSGIKISGLDDYLIGKTRQEAHQSHLRASI